MRIEDITVGESWACEFTTTTFLDENGAPVSVNLQVGQSHPGAPGAYTSVGVIQVRDTDNRTVRLQDTRTEQIFVVSWDNIRNVDRVEWRNT